MLAVLEVGNHPDTPTPAGTFETAPFAPSRVLPDARQALRDAGLAPAAFEDALQGLEVALTPPGPIDLSALRRGPLGPWLDQLLVEQAGEWSTALYLVPASDRWRSRPPPRLEEIAAEEGAALVGLNTLSEAMRRQTWQDLEVVAAGADEAALNAALGETSKAVLLASLTTAVGFGSLALSGFAGLRSVGWLSVFGALGAGLAALTILAVSLAD